MALSTSVLEQTVQTLVSLPLPETEVESYDHLNFYAFLEISRSASAQTIFSTWCHKSNAYLTSPFWTSLPPDSPDRQNHEKTLRIIAQVLLSPERRTLYDIRLIVREGLRVDWSTVVLTSTQSAYLRRMITQDFGRLQQKLNRANAEFNDAMSRFQFHCQTLNTVVQ